MDATQLCQLGPRSVALRGGVLEHSSLAEPLAIGANPVTVGRGASCTLPLKDPQVSTAHCRLVATEFGVLVEDLGSRNGTFIGTTRLRAHSGVYLAASERIRVGRTVLDFSPAEPVRQELAQEFGVLSSRSPCMRRVLTDLHKIAPLPTTVLITGESGTGKEYIARAIHAASNRASKPFVVIDCASLPAHLVESTLFGHERGAFTGASQRRVSPFVEARGGTVFLDEIGELPPEAQARLLRVVAEKEVQAVGQNRWTKVDVRVIAATLRDLAAAVNQGKFREDLYHRLSQTRIELPPLRERLEDLDLIARRVLCEMGRPELTRAITASVSERLRKYTWVGNTRQLKDVIQLAVARSEGGTLDVDEAYALSGGTRGLGRETQAPTLSPGTGRPHLGGDPVEATFAALTVHGTSLDEVLKEAKRVLLTVLFRRTNGTVNQIARLATVSRRHAREQLEFFGIRKRSPRRLKSDENEDEDQVLR